MLTVWCVRVGNKYPIGYVYALRDMVDKNLTIPYTFRCISDQEIPGVFCVPPKLDHKSWWAKFSLFPTVNSPSIYLDLDVVITGNIDYLADYTGTFSAAANWAQSGYGGIQSSVMAWPGNWSFPYDELMKVWPGETTSDGYTILNGQKFWGDQEFLWELLGDKWQAIPHVGSYKYHVRPTKKIPDWMKICVFHGRPDPHEVQDKCILPFINKELFNV